MDDLELDSNGDLVFDGADDFSQPVFNKIESNMSEIPHLLNNLTAAKSKTHQEKH